MYDVVFTILLLASPNSFPSQHRPDNDRFSNAVVIFNDTTKTITYQIIPSKDNTFGYDIFVSGKKYIHQPTIPSAAGAKGFARKEDCAKVAELVISKIKNGELPPSVTKAEIRALGILIE